MPNGDQPVHTRLTVPRPRGGGKGNGVAGTGGEIGRRRSPEEVSDGRGASYFPVQIIVIVALMALLSALSTAELTRWLPTEGSSYEIARRLLSPATAFLAGWM
jgi:hypothetical protein